MPDILLAMREFRALDDKRRLGGLTAEEEFRWLDLKAAVNGDAPVPLGRIPLVPMARERPGPELVPFPTAPELLPFEVSRVSYLPAVDERAIADGFASLPQPPEPPVEKTFGPELAFQVPWEASQIEQPLPFPEPSIRLGPLDGDLVPDDSLDYEAPPPFGGEVPLAPGLEFDPTAFDHEISVAEVVALDDGSPIAEVIAREDGIPTAEAIALDEIPTAEVFALEEIPTAEVIALEEIPMAEVVALDGGLPEAEVFALDDGIPMAEAIALDDGLPPEVDTPAQQLAGSDVVRGSHRVAIHTRDGVVKRGHLKDACLSAPSLSLDTQQGTVETLRTDHLQVIFFMRDPGAEGQVHSGGTRARLVFPDGRPLQGTVDGPPEGDGFFLFPSDTRGNSSRIWVYTAAVRDIVLEPT